MAMTPNEQKFHAMASAIAGIRNHLLNYSIADPVLKRAARVRDFLTNPGRNVWHEHKITRGGKETVAIQVLANTETLGLENKAAIAALTALVGQLAAGQNVDYERIKEDTRQVLAEGVITADVNINVNQKEQP
jgi:hypothetical protein